MWKKCENGIRFNYGDHTLSISAVDYVYWCVSLREVFRGGGCIINLFWFKIPPKSSIDFKYEIRDAIGDQIFHDFKGVTMMMRNLHKIVVKINIDENINSLMEKGYEL